MENPNKVNVYRFYDDEIYLEFIVHKEGDKYSDTISTKA